ncbi:MAG TPA: VWA domain-containing protein [Pyrinomonadaceae bacterium]|nr:VWA domain-containing protein [Pyrinomonadaceae bacterium]
MNKLFSLLVLVSLTFSTLVPLQAQQPTQPAADEVVRISTNLVQLDAVVTDKDGNPKKDLTAADFEVLQDGKPQKLVSATYVDTDFPDQPVAQTRIDKTAPLAPPTRTRLENTGRLLTFVVDDGNCDVSPLGMKATREGLEKFVREQMRPDDLVAIYQTRTGSSMLQQFTSDKAQLLRTISKIRWHLRPVFCPEDPFQGHSSGRETSFERANREKMENRGRDSRVGSLAGVLRFVIRGLQKLPGRKSIYLFSDGIYFLSSGSGIRSPSGFPNQRFRMTDVMDYMKDLVDAANRASVVIYTIDVRGVGTTYGGITASEWFEGDQPGRVSGMSGGIDPDSRSGLFYLADETGGKFYHDANDLNRLVRKAISQEKGYYRIGYQPDEDTFKGKRFNKIEIKVKRPDLSVRSHSGFLGVTDESLRSKKRTGDSELYEAIVSPLPHAGLDLHLTAFFGSTEPEGGFMRTAVYLDGEQLSFVDEPNGLKKAVFDVVAVTLDQKNEVVEDFNRTHTIRFPAAYLAEVQQKGLVYSANIPVKKPGMYNFRVAIRDVNSKQIGSAGQPIEVPDLTKNNLVLSELNLGEVAASDSQLLVMSGDKVESGFAAVTTVSSPAVRRFRPGAMLGYSYKIYNAAIDKTTRKPNLTVQVRLYRDGEVIKEDPAQLAAQVEPQADLRRIGNHGTLRLPEDLPAGAYALQVVIKDSKSNKTTSQWIDFEVIR